MKECVCVCVDIYVGCVNDGGLYTKYIEQIKLKREDNDLHERIGWYLLHILGKSHILTRIE